MADSVPSQTTEAPRGVMLLVTCAVCVAGIWLIAVFACFLFFVLILVNGWPT